MGRYIIKNCPSCRDFDVFGLPNEGCCYNFNDYCSRHNECVLKQIVELCKDYYKNCEIEGNCIDGRTCTSCFFGGGNELAQDILSDLDIQEVE